MARFEVRLSDEELEELRERAWVERLSVSESVRRVLFPPGLEELAVPVPAGPGSRPHE